MIQLNSWTKLQIGHLCFGNGCFKREKTLFYDIISNIYFYIYLRTHIYHAGFAIYTVWVWNTFFWCLNHTSANYSICFSSHYQMHFWMQMRCKTCLNLFKFWDVGCQDFKKKDSSKQISSRCCRLRVAMFLFKCAIRARQRT